MRKTETAHTFRIAKGWLACLSAAVLLTSCVTTSYTLALQSVQSVWVGRYADDFFSRFGVPDSTYEMRSGEKIHTWRSEPVKQIGSGGSYVDVGPVIGDTYTVTTTTYSPKYLSCELQITVSPGGVIKAIEVTDDTTGQMKFSRFDEVFSNDPEIKAVKESLKATTEVQ